MFTLPKLDYSYDALEPFIDTKTMEIHHTKHHQTYVDNLNKIISENNELKEKTLEQLVLLPETKNMAGGHFNHSLWWQIIGPPTESKIPDEILKFKDEFSDKALKLFGSGWVWLGKDESGNLKVIKTPLQDSPLNYKLKPILGIDLWEHAYYIQYKWNRAEYIQNWWNVVNWDYVSKNI